MSKIIFFEGLPGSGKTTYAKRIYEYLSSQNIDVDVFYEGDLQPIDLAWCSVIEEKEFASLLEKYSLIKDDLLKLSRIKDNLYITAYTKVKVPDQYKDFYDTFGKYEIYRLEDINEFKNTHLELYKEFNETHNTDKTYIFECIFLQNHINELILKNNFSLNEMKQYFDELLSCLNSFEITIVYLSHKDVEANLNKVIEERRNEFYKDWIELVVEYFEKQKYSKQLGYIGEKGALQYFLDRKDYEIQILKSLNISKIVIEIDNDFEKAYQEITKYLDS